MNVNQSPLKFSAIHLLQNKIAKQYDDTKNQINTMLFLTKVIERESDVFSNTHQEASLTLYETVRLPKDNRTDIVIFTNTDTNDLDEFREWAEYKYSYGSPEYFKLRREAAELMLEEYPENVTVYSEEL